MSELSWRHDSRKILLTISVLKPEPVSDLSSVEAVALLDTGSTTSGVTRGIAERLQLPHLGKRPLASAHGEAQVERFLFRFGLPVEGEALPFVFDEVNGFELKNGFAFQALIGMDILKHCDFSMDRGGRCRLGFGA
jgi:predicted aspartyl protease